MITDLLNLLTALDRATDEPLDDHDAVDAVISSASRDVSQEEQEEFRSVVVEEGWLDD